MRLYVASLQAAGFTGREPLKRCALVGNSQQQLTDPTRGAVIDGFDFVMRLNQAPTEGFEAFVGNKTSMRLINAAWQGAVYSVHTAACVALYIYIHLHLKTCLKLVMQFRLFGHYLCIKARAVHAAFVLSLKSILK